MEEEKVLLEAVLCFPVQNGQVLFARKTRHIGKGCWNGYGGGIEPGETSLQAVVREMREESGLVAQPEHFTLAGIMDFHNTKEDGQSFVCRVYTYLLTQWEGEIEETEEMAAPTWFPFDCLPVEEMMPADRDWIPPVLAGKKIRGRAKYGPRQQTLLEPVFLEEVETLEAA